MNGGPGGMNGGPGGMNGGPGGMASQLKETIKKAGVQVDASKRKATLKIAMAGDGEGERENLLERSYDADGNLADVTQTVKGKSPDGRAAEGARTKKFKPDGSHQITFKGLLKMQGYGDVKVEWSKEVGSDGKVTGQGFIFLPNGKQLPFSLNGFKPNNGKPKKWGELLKPGSLKPGVKPGEEKPADDKPGLKPGDLKPGNLPNVGIVQCSPEDTKIGMAGNAAVSNVLNIQVTNDLGVIAGGAKVTVAFKGTGTHLGQGNCTFVNLFDAGYKNGQTGNPVGGAENGAYQADGENGQVTIDPSGLQAGSYWLRFSTKFKDGSWEVAEGVLMVH
ncbi:MAG: hypothetical protein VKP62_15545 [Candidatus Sericytochromatia bacterium]|nr:hypothetical protein [Candidatus Sericytochromatia bacterium]